jgi:antitoxin YefM
MYAITSSDARANPEAVMDRVVADRAPVAITRQRGESGVIVARSDWEVMEETLYLRRRQQTRST